MAFRRLTPRMGSVELSDEQALVLACLEAGLNDADTCESTGLDAERLDEVVRGLRQLQALGAGQPALDGSYPGAPEGPSGSPAPSNDSELPEGVEPWSGEQLPQGTASSHDLHAPVADGVDPDLEPASAHEAPPADAELNYRRLYETHFRDLPLGERERAARQAHVQQAEADFDPLPFDAAAARSFGQVAASLRRAGRKRSARAYDAMIAAVCVANQLPVHTCNPDDFSGIDGLDVVDVPHPDR